VIGVSFLVGVLWCHHHQTNPHQPPPSHVHKPTQKEKRGQGKAPTRHQPPPPHKKTVAATYSPTPPQGSTISVRRLHDRVRKETGYNPSTKTTTEKHVNK